MVAVSSQRRRNGFTLVEMLVVIVIISVLAGLLIPVISHVLFRGRVVTCQNNLSQLYKLGTVYSSSRRGNWPSAKGEELWLSLRKAVPPLIAKEHAAILHCKVTMADGELGPDETNYRGPVVSFARLDAVDPLGADKAGNHGEQYGGNVLYTDGRVEELPLDDPNWSDIASSKLSP